MPVGRARDDSAIGAVVTQCLTGAVLTAAAAPLVASFLTALAATALPELYRVSGWRLAITSGVCAVLAAVGVLAGIVRGF